MVDVTEEIIFTGSNPTVDRQTRRLAASGQLRKIHSSIYTSNLTDPRKHWCAGHALEIAGHLFPGACYREGPRRKCMLRVPWDKMGREPDRVSCFSVM